MLQRYRHHVIFILKKILSCIKVAPSNLDHHVIKYTWLI